ncbi:hypothetical protein THAOC_13172 [Thalassiosira oceanica]|uniref:Uncharacterized protein n=1 Tax=Thalassiosira oceanica TaxID=159749 RepID=K0SI77_THAOC|nr:hypothetical protein THAOC_13172 [Thalassiosira oceanica]|eukprot:EJK65928.1 hypothetical protein THAOC_13172 [Thalassiosira oceanica]
MKRGYEMDFLLRDASGSILGSHCSSSAALGLRVPLQPRHGHSRSVVDAVRGQRQSSRLVSSVASPSPPHSASQDEPYLSQAEHMNSPWCLFTLIVPTKSLDTCSGRDLTWPR